MGQVKFKSVDMHLTLSDATLQSKYYIRLHNDFTRVCEELDPVHGNIPLHRSRLGLKKICLLADLSTWVRGSQQLLIAGGIVAGHIHGIHSTCALITEPLAGGHCNWN